MRNVKKAMTGIICITLLLKSKIYTIEKIADLSAEYFKKRCISAQIFWDLCSYLSIMDKKMRGFLQRYHLQYKQV